MDAESVISTGSVIRLHIKCLATDSFVLVFQPVFLDNDLKYFLRNRAVHKSITVGRPVHRNAPHFSILSSFLFLVKKYSI
jgi:hypothetical protein